jgi:hypothetical protein
MWKKYTHARIIAFYIMGLSTKTLRNALFVELIDSIIEKLMVIMRTATKTEEKTDQKGVLVLFYHSSFKALVFK